MLVGLCFCHLLIVIGIVSFLKVLWLTVTYGVITLSIKLPNSIVIIQPLNFDFKEHGKTKMYEV